MESIDKPVEHFSGQPVDSCRRRSPASGWKEFADTVGMARVFERGAHTDPQ